MKFVKNCFQTKKHFHKHSFKKILYNTHKIIRNIDNKHRWDFEEEF